MTRRTLLYWGRVWVLVLIAGIAQPPWASALTTGEPEELHASDKTAADQFGASVALSEDGNTLLVGAPNTNCHAVTPPPPAPAYTVCAGTAYFFTRSGTSWTQQQEIAGPAEGAVQMAPFGSSVALSQDGSTALVGAPGTDSTFGAVYVYVLSGGSWSLQQKLAGKGPSFFGSPVALSQDGNTALVGAPYTGPYGSKLQFAGAAYIFTRSQTTWSNGTKLVAKPALEAGDHFGTAVALSQDGGTALVGAPGAKGGLGAVYAFVSPNWSQQARIEKGELGAGANFGNSVALSGDTALVGVPGRSAYVYTRSGNNWGLRNAIFPSGLRTNASSSAFGSAVALSSDIAVVGAPDGQAYVFSRSGTSWEQATQELILSPDSHQEHDMFGARVALAGMTVAFGAAPALLYPGTAYVYTLQTSNAPPTTPFSVFDVTRTLAGAQVLILNAKFILSRASKGILPLTEPLTLKIGDFTTTIPAGSFSTARRSFIYAGQIGNDVWVDARILRLGGKRYGLQMLVWGTGVSLGPQNCLAIDLTIGNDEGVGGVCP